MTLRTRLFLLVGGVVAVAVTLVTWSISASARRSFETLDRQRTDALVQQFRRELATQQDDVKRRLDRLASTDLVLRTAHEIGRRGTDYAPFVNEAASLAALQGLDFLDLVADDGTIISSAHWPARFGYRQAWATNRRDGPSGEAFLQAIDLPGETALGLVAVRAVPSGARTISIAGGRRLDQRIPQVAPAAARHPRLVVPECRGRGLAPGADRCVRPAVPGGAAPAADRASETDRSGARRDGPVARWSRDGPCHSVGRRRRRRSRRVARRELRPRACRVDVPYPVERYRSGSSRRRHWIRRSAMSSPPG